MLWCLQYNVQLTLKFLFCLPKLLQFRKVLVQDEHFREAQSGHDGCQLIERSTNQSMWSRTLKALFKHKFVVGRRKALRVSTDFRDWNAHANIQRVFCVVPRYVQVRSIAKRPLRTMLLCIGMVDCGDCVGFFAHFKPPVCMANAESNSVYDQVLVWRRTRECHDRLLHKSMDLKTIYVVRYNAYHFSSMHNKTNNTNKLRDGDQTIRDGQIVCLYFFDHPV